VPLVWAWAPRGGQNHGQPKVVTSPKLSSLARDGLSLGGLAFFDGALYMGTNAGLVEVRDGSVSKVLRFQDSFSVVSGPWLDPANHLLWAVDESSLDEKTYQSTEDLLRLDGKQWTRMPKPATADDYMGSGNDEGTQPIGNAQAFWLVQFGSLWRLDSPSMIWQAVKMALPPPADDRSVNQMIGVLPIGQTPLLIIRHEPRAGSVSPGETFVSDEVTASPAVNSAAIERQGDPFLSGTWAVTADAAYICTKNQTLVKVTRQLVGVLPAPGPCEALAGGTDPDLLVSIRRKGVFRYSPKNGWTPIANSPYPSGDGEYWAFLAAGNGQVAFAICGKPVVDEKRSRGADMKFVENAPTALWILRGRDFVPVPLR